MLKLNEFTQRMNEAREFLEEKLIKYNGGKKYGQVVFIAGGAGSGKGFAISQFMEGDKFKIRDVDEMKGAFLKLNKLTGKYPELKGLNLKTPEDVFKLHTFVKDKGIKDKTLMWLLSNKDVKRLPNIIFDITSKDIGDITKVTPLLERAGYKPQDIHLTWVLTDYKVAIKNNADRDRVVPADILMKTHVGAARTMSEIMIKNKLPRSVLDGGVYVVLNNRENTVAWSKDDKVSNSKEARAASVAGVKGDNDNNIKANMSGKHKKTNIKSGFKLHVKTFTYITMKKPRKAPTDDDNVKAQLFDWIDKNAPKGWDK